MRVLITGATGFIGQAMLPLLLAEDMEVVILGRHPYIAPSSPASQPRFIACDLLTTRQETLNAHIRDFAPEALVHLAWYAEHGRYWQAPVNAEWFAATCRLVEAFCQNGGKRLVMAGSCAEYDWRYGYCQESLTPLSPHSAYGQAKAACCQWVLGRAAYYGSMAYWGRVFIPFGPQEAPQRLIPSLIACLRGKIAPFAIYGDAYRDFLPVYEVSRAFLHLLTTHAPPGAYNIASGAPLRLRELVEKLAELMGADPQPLQALMAPRANDPAFLVGAVEALTQSGFTRRQTLLEGLKISLTHTP
jgi:nucleoside-diphosphate-sugar epimerase